jgi:hypothetical protein
MRSQSLTHSNAIMKIKRRSFFVTMALAIGSIFVPRLAKTDPSRELTNRYLDYLTGGTAGNAGPGPCPVGPKGPAGPRAFSNRFLSRYEGRSIPSNVVFGQAVGGINHTPFHSQQPIRTLKLRSTTKDDS